MPSRPSAARRRVHRERVIAKRLNQARSLSLTDPADYVRGRLVNEQWYLGCHRARCGLCHPAKAKPNADRQRAEREWRWLDDRGWRG
jgi:hypothetical protein